MGGLFKGFFHLNIYKCHIHLNTCSEIIIWFKRCMTKLIKIPFIFINVNDVTVNCILNHVKQFLIIVYTRIKITHFKFMFVFMFKYVSYMPL